jgi:N-acetylglucosaminyldiphosphoundecaprenol N-acetyl-beta-D-mannosaminyltransferase
MRATDGVRVGGLFLARVTRDELCDEVFAALSTGRGGWLVTANVDFLRRAAREPEIFELYAAADRILADGMPLLWSARLAGHPLPERIAGSDLVWSLAERAAREGRSIYLLGGAGDSARKAAERLAARWPELCIAGHSSPRVSADPQAAELDTIRSVLVAARPDIVYVGLGSPKQERVIRALRPDLPGAWMLGCGIGLSFIAGDVRRAPRWMQRSGLEWVHRLAQEPGRLARRYLVQDLPFTVRLLASALLTRWHEMF